ncbi:MAG: hypothetical protein E7307_09490 [Butyrivibrio sp.]|nr:hypothetical protein [Butyrivibrio sp.]
MRKYKDLRHRILALVLAFVMTVSMGSGASMKAYAVEGDPDEAAVSASLASSEDGEPAAELDASDETLGDKTDPTEGAGDELTPDPGDGTDPAIIDGEGDPDAPDTPAEGGSEGKEDGADEGTSEGDPEDLVSSDESDIPSEEASEDASVDEASDEASEEALLEEEEDKALVGEGTALPITLENVNTYGEEGAALKLVGFVVDENTDIKGNEADGYSATLHAGDSGTSFSFELEQLAGYTQLDIDKVVNISFIYGTGENDKINKEDVKATNGIYTASLTAEDIVDKTFTDIKVSVSSTINAKFRVYTNNEHGNQGMLSITSFTYKISGGTEVTLVSSDDYDSQLVTEGKESATGFYTKIPLRTAVTVAKQDVVTWWDDNAKNAIYTDFTHPYLFKEGDEEKEIAEEGDNYSFTLALSDLDEGGYANFRIEGRPITQFYFDPESSFELKEGIVDNTKTDTFHEIIDFEQDGTTEKGRWYVAPVSGANFEFQVTSDDVEHTYVRYCSYELQWFNDPEPIVFDTGKCTQGADKFTIAATDVKSFIERGANLVRITAETYKVRNVIIDANTASMKIDSVRVGSQIVNPVYDTGKGVYTVGAEDNSQVVVTVSALDCHKITGVKIQDAAHKDLSTIPVAANGQYTIKVGTSDARLEFVTAEDFKITVRDNASPSNILAPVGGVYSLSPSQSVTVYLAYDADGTPAIIMDSTGTTKGIVATSVSANGVVIDGAKNKGKTGTVTIKPKGGQAYTVKLAVASDITSITVAGEKNGTITLPYGTSKDVKVTVKDAKADKERIELKRVNESGVPETLQYGFHFDKSTSTLKIDAEEVLMKKSECPAAGLPMYYAFFVDGEIFGGVHKVLFTNPVAGTKPTVKVSVNDSTLHEIGLSFALPKGVSASSKGLYYWVTATASDKDKAPWDNYDPGDSEGTYTPSTKNNLNDWDWNEHKLVQVYKEEVVAYIPATQKTASIRVATENIDPYWGWNVEYDVTVKLIFSPDTTANPVFAAAESNSDGPVETRTRSHCYETKLGLTKKAPAKIYAGQNNVLVAIPKFSAATTVRSLDYVTILNAQGNNIGSYYSDDPNKEENLRWIYIDEDTNEIYLNTKYAPDDDYLVGGKYTIIAYARAGSGLQASAKVDVTVCNPIADLELTPAATYVLKTYNKAATLKTSIKYMGLYNDPRRAPANKKVTYKVAKRLVYDEVETGKVIDFEMFAPGDPLYGKISVNQKNGTVTVDKSFLVTSNPANNIFYVVAEAADYDGNGVWTYTDPVEISSVSRIPTTIRLMHVVWHHDDETNTDIIDEENDSGIRDGDKDVNSGNASYLTPYVYDQNFDRINSADYTVKSTGFFTTWDGMLVDNKPGKKTVTVTSNDGTKKSKKIQFTTVYGDSSYKMDVIFQNGRKEWDDGNSYCSWTYNGSTKVYEGENTCPSPNPVYISIQGYIDHEEDDPAWRETVLLNHTLKVTKGGKLKSTGYGQCGVATTYTIIPTAYKTEFTVTDKTAGRAADDKVKKYVIYNTAYTSSGDAKAIKLTADKKSIVSGLDVRDGDYATDPNLVTFTTTQNLPPFVNRAIVTMDNPGEDVNKWEFMRAISGTNDDDATWAVCREGKPFGIIVGEKSFSIGFYEVETRTEGEGEDQHTYTYHRTGDIKAGTYTFYVTLGMAVSGVNEGDPETFTAVAAPTKVSIKVAPAPAPKAVFATTKLVYKDNTPAGLQQKLKVPNVTNGLAVNDYPRLGGVVTKGLENDFANILEIDNNEGRAIITADGCYTIKLRTDAECRVFVGKSKEQMGIEFKDLWKLRAGTMTDRGFNDVSAADQKAAYKDWLKNNKTGYISYEMIKLDGSFTAYNSAKLTVDLESIIDSYTSQ